MLSGKEGKDFWWITKIIYIYKFQNFMKVNEFWDAYEHYASIIRSKCSWQICPTFHHYTLFNKPRVDLDKE